LIRKDVKETQLFNELSFEKQNRYFNLTRSKYLHNIDTLYYTIRIKEDSNDDIKLIDMFRQLDEIKVKVKDTNNKDVPQFFGHNVKLGSYGMVYNFRLQEPDLYDIYISDYLPNKNTPRIVVQLRAYGLWTHGVEEMINLSYYKVKELLIFYNCEIDLIKENRIDYAYHTNAIQNAYRFFSDKKLDKYLHTNLSKYYKIGDIRTKGSVKKRFTLDYFSLGQLKSNNLFNRNYNKVKEVIELNYKAFFFDMWLENGVINAFDKYCFEYAYKKKNYNAIAEGRLKFYLEHGTDMMTKREIQFMFQDINTRYDDMLILANLITPSTTDVMNIEFQTKRKFYYYADKEIDLFPIMNKNTDEPLKRLYKIIDNRKIFLDYITSQSVAFIKKIEKDENDNKIITYCDFWKRLRSCKISSILQKGYYRDYSTTVDTEKIVKRAVNNIATLGLYKENEETDFITDLSDLLGHLNDNDINDFDICIRNNDTAEYLDIKSLDLSNIHQNYMLYKHKKNKAIKNRISKSMATDEE